ncbi:MAG: ComEC family competence protein [Rhodospirillaceae bacterium]|nr:ComEC family competence protein [Rhodospirillaceae bacterium]
MLRTIGADFYRALRDELTGQANAAFLWFVVAFACGIAMFFAWPTDPWAWTGPLIAGLGVAALVWRRKADPMMALLLAVVAVGLGWSAAQLRTSMVAAPVITREIGPLNLTGRVLDVEREPGRIKVVMDHMRYDGGGPPEKPQRIRLSLPAKHGAPRVGEVILVRAVLSPPERPVVPGGFEFQRYLFFQRIGALGYTLQPWQRSQLPLDPKLIVEVRQSIEGLRRSISDRILDVIPGDAGAVTVALVTGEQSLIPEKLQDQYRASGLAHLLSISGLHMTLLAAVVFFIVRRALALWSAFALRYDLKRIAAWAALAATTFYVLISGMSVPALRAYIMVAAVITAIFFDRRVISLRSVALAALALLAVFPESVVGASFQMSFLAVIALVAMYEHFRLKPRWRDGDGNLRIGYAIGVYVAALIVTDLVAGSVTSVLAAYHFNQVPVYSLAANVMAAPITGFWVMPLGIVALTLMPFGWDAPVLSLMGEGVAFINTVVVTVAAWPGAQIHVPPMMPWALVCAIAGVVMICLWRGRLRWAGAVPLLIGLAQPWVKDAPNLIVDESGRVLAVQDARGGMALNTDRRDRFVRTVIKERYGASKTRWPTVGKEGPGKENADLGLTCDRLACNFTQNKTVLTLAFSRDAITEDCGAASIMIAPQEFVDACGDTFVIDRGNLRAKGGHAIYLSNGRARIETVEDFTGDRVWSRKPKPFAKPTAPGPQSGDLQLEDLQPEPTRADDFGNAAEPEPAND